MTKLEAIQAMKKGKKVTHKYFSPDEWMTIKNRKFLFEDGVECEPEDFWNDRKLIDWEDEYSLFIEPKKS